MYQTIEEIIERLLSNLTEADIQQQLLVSIVDELGPEIGITGARLWAFDRRGYQLTHQYRGKKQIPLGFRIPNDYPAVSTLCKAGYVCHEKEDRTLDRSLEDELGVEDFVAVAIGIDTAYIASFDTTPEIATGQQPDLLSKQKGALRRIARATAIALNNAERHQRTLRERDFAYQILLDMLPDSAPHFQGFDICGKAIFSTEIGGDCYNFIRLPNGNLNLIIADAKGHGLHATATISLLHNALLRSMVSTESQIGEVVTMLNRKLVKRTSVDNFVTMFYAELNLDGELTYCNAGQTPPLLFDVHNTIELNIGGPILGVLDSVEYPIDRILLERGNLLVLYTDGITEALNPDAGMFGVQRLIDVVLQNQAGCAEEIADKVLESVIAFGGPPQDDMTVVVVRRTE